MIQITDAYIPLLLADPSPVLRRLVLRDLLARPVDDPECIELADLSHGDPLWRALVERQDDDGAWRRLDVDATGGPIRLTAQALLRLAFLGCGPDEEAVARGAGFLFSCQTKDGAWPLGEPAHERAEGEGYDMVPLQTAIPLRALAACGHAQNRRAERAYEWLLDKCLPDGAWPAGLASGTLGYIAGYRRLPHSRWGCRANTTGVLAALAHHPVRCYSDEARRALDLLLGRETRERQAMGFEVARTVGAEPSRGFFTYYARFDVAYLLNLCRLVGASPADERVADLVAYVLAQRSDYGLWSYDAQPQASRWVTFDLLRSLSALDATSDWLGVEPRTPFRPYDRPERRF